MVLQSSGTISFGQISAEFGLPSGKNLGAYRVSETHGALSNMPLDAGVPQSGQISFGNFYSKRLNMVVDFYSGGTQYRQNARSNYNNNTKIRVIGGHRSRPANSSGKKVFIHVNKYIGSAKGSASYCALRTGGWNSGTTLRVDVGGNGFVLGAGGNGGSGARSNNDSGDNGAGGSSGLGIEYSGTTVVVASGGAIQCGFGGGGGGGGAKKKFSSGGGGGKGGKGGGGGSKTLKAGGGGGGGGAGLPGGSGGSGGSANYSGSGGSSGSTFSRGGGGTGGNRNSGDDPRGGNGGSGGQNGVGAAGGERGKGEDESNGGSAGGNGNGIRKSSSGISFSSSGNIIGGTGTGVA